MVGGRSFSVYDGLQAAFYTCTPCEGWIPWGASGSLPRDEGISEVGRGKRHKCSSTTTITMTTFDNTWIRKDVVKHFVNRAMDMHKQVGELRLISEFDLQWLPPSYLKHNTKSTEIMETWEKLPLDIRNNEEMKALEFTFVGMSLRRSSAAKKKVCTI
ncbi:hypothetical protein FQA39_LY01457 [Lamprigera yunnana]|nr:hypothetical protein FQA39_LY01457 [Lamprigera yunnana]